MTFSQEINEPAKSFPCLPKEINIIKVRKPGRGDSSKDFRVRRYKIQAALTWLKCNNPAFQYIQISQERLQMLPMDGELTDVDSVEFPLQILLISMMTALLLNKLTLGKFQDFLILVSLCQTNPLVFEKKLKNF